MNTALRKKKTKIWGCKEAATLEYALGTGTVLLWAGFTSSQPCPHNPKQNPATYNPKA
jgi:hypothetical protein